MTEDTGRVILRQQKRVRSHTGEQRALMPLGSRDVVERLLDLFPKEALYDFEEVTTKITKAEAISTVARVYEVDRILAFVAARFGLLHQHVYLLQRVAGRNAAAPFGEPFGERVVGDERHRHYLAEFAHNMVVEPPLERVRVDFAWPIKVVESPTHVRLHLAIMSGSPSVPEGKTLVKWSQQPTEAEAVELFRTSRGAEGRVALDLNKGIKALWAADRFDAGLVQYKESRSTTRHVMDEQFMLKAHQPELYDSLRLRPILATTFRFLDEGSCTPYFNVSPTEGWFRFRRHPTSNECIDHVIQSILEAN